MQATHPDDRNAEAEAASFLVVAKPAAALREIAETRAIAILPLNEDFVARKNSINHTAWRHLANFLFNEVSSGKGRQAAPAQDDFEGLCHGDAGKERL